MSKPIEAQCVKRITTDSAPRGDKQYIIKKTKQGTINSCIYFIDIPYGGGRGGAI